MKQNTLMVVARYDEDLSWICQIDSSVRIVIYNKGLPLECPQVLSRADEIISRPNVGRESDTYLYHLLTSGNREEEWLIFTQGDPVAHSPDFVSLLECRDKWHDVQPLTIQWLEEHNIPPRGLIETRNPDWIGDLRVRRDVYSLNTWCPIGFHDSGAMSTGKDYLSGHLLPPGTNIAAHFLNQCGWREKAEEAFHSDLGQFCYGAIFAVRRKKVNSIPPPVIERLRALASSHPIYGYIIERLWLHFFGLPFLRIFH